MAASSSSSSSSSSQPKNYDVFINFKGPDVRKGFLSHLRKALLDEGVDAFLDEQLERGEDISSSLLKTIEQSSLALVIFSKNYAFSQWCLDELVKIKQCKKTMGQIVIPVFYEVDTDDVQELRGNFGDAIAEHIKEKSSGTVQSWCQALKEIANLSGVVSGKDEPDSELIKKIINHILEKLNVVFPSDDSYNNDGLVGIDERVKCVESLLHIELEDVRVIGIWGMSGIGKTTVANQVFNSIRHQFPVQCFVADVREMSESKIDRFQSEVLSGLLGTANTSTSTTNLLSPFNRKKLAKKKVLIVLDDVSDLKQVELLIGEKVKYGPCSRIIVTSRDEQLLKNVGAEIYKVEELNMDEALWLFCLHAFGKSTPEEGYEMLSKIVAIHVQGLPLALKNLGCTLYGKSVEEWNDVQKNLGDTLEDALRFLEWPGYPKKSLPIGFCAKNPAELEGVQNFENLRVIDLSHCEYLFSIPDLSTAINLVVLRVTRCASLVEIPPSIKYLRKLAELDLSWCTNLRILPNCLHLENLKRIVLFNCSKIENLPNIPFYERHDGIALEQAVSLSSFQLYDIDLGQCDRLRSLPDNICNLKCLGELSVRYCKDLRRLPEHLGNLESLTLLEIGGSGIEELPDSICHLKRLTSLDISECWNLVRLPEKLRDLTCLLKFVAVRCGIKYLPQLPSSLENLKVKYCKSLESTSLQMVKELAHVRDFMFFGCPNLGEKERNKMMDQALERPFFNITEHREFSKDLYLCFPGSEVAEKIKYKNKSGSSLSLSIPQCGRRSDIRGFYFCAVVDPNLFSMDRFYSLQCEIVLDLSSRSSFCYSMQLESRHLFLWRWGFSADKFSTDTAVFSFFLEGDKDKSRCCDAIIECGVHPIFYDHDEVCLVTEE